MDGEGEESRVKGGEAKALLSLLNVGLRVVLISYRRVLAVARSIESMMLVS